jgi:hypothetical protein
MTINSGSDTASAGIPGNVVPVPSQCKNQNQDGYDYDASGLKSLDPRRTMTLGFRGALGL